MDDKLLLVKHKGLRDGPFWSPPGGGIEFGKTAEMTLIREFDEETGLIVEVDRFQFACEFLQEPLHALELFFHVHQVGGALKVGSDPEMSDKEQIIEDVGFYGDKAIQGMDQLDKHGIFNHFNDLKRLKTVTGYYKI
jgi:8-oxo-dGTP diphosphatase